jgi:hypothetical protein
MTWFRTGNNIAPTDFLGTLNEQPLVIKTNQAADNSEKVRVNPDGNVGIGKVPASGTPYRLDVEGPINATDIHKDGAPLRVSQWKKVSGGISYTAGNVGIGTTQPENAEEWNKVLDVLGDDAGGAKLSVRTESVDAQVWAAAGEWWGAPAGMAVGTKSAHALSFATGGSSKMTIDPQGNVGIGKEPTSAYKLDMAGPINATDYHRDGRALIAAGRTPPGLDWQQYPNNAGVFIDVNTEGYHFSTTPVYVTALHGTSHHWATTGGSSVYFPTPTGFRVYLRKPDGGSLLVSEAQSLGWHIQWIATETS